MTAATLPPGQATLRTWMQAGAVVRGNVRSALRLSAWNLHLELDLQEDKRWTVSTFYVTVRGKEADVRAFEAWLLRLGAEYA